jgi:hypothetical protein
MVAAAVQVLVALAHLAVGRRGVVPLLLLGLLLLWWTQRRRLWCRCTPSWDDAANVDAAVAAAVQVLVTLAH